MGESHVKLEVPDTCTLIERYNFFSMNLQNYSTFDDFLNDIQHKSNTCNFLERENIIRDIVIVNVAALNKDGLLPALNDSLTFIEIVNLCRNCITFGDFSPYFDGKIETVEGDVKSHYDICESEIKPEVCLNEISTLDDSLHESLNDRKRFECKFCENTYGRKGDLTRHTRKIHQNDEKIPPVQAKITKNTKKTKNKTKRSKINVNEEPIKSEPDQMITSKSDLYPCNDCDKSFNTTQDLQTHINRTHTLVQCLQCDEQFSRRALRQHKKQTHPKQPFDGECKICHKHLRKSALRNHMDRHRYKKLLADPHADPVLLERLRRRVCERAINVPCHICGKIFRYQSRFKDHLRRHMGVKKFSCKQCPKTFVNSALLYSHVVTHTETRAFKCQYCDKVFKRKSTLKGHETIHLGIKPYQCSFCDKSFTCWASRRYHERLHTGECPFKCSYCDRAFPQPNGLKSHLKTHTNARVKPHETHATNE